MTEYWYSYGEIAFYRRHVQWVCDHAVTLRDGKWPPEPRNTGYTNAPGRREIKSEGTFVKPGLVWAEVERRLDRCSKEGHLAIGYYLGEVSMEWLLNWEKCAENDMWRKMQRAVSYAGSGPCPRWQGCLSCIDLSMCMRQKRLKESEPAFRGLTYGEWLVLRHQRRRVMLPPVARFGGEPPLSGDHSAHTARLS